MVDNCIEAIRGMCLRCKYARKTDAAAKRIPRTPNVIVWIVSEDE
jgi:hypothetical protein